MRNERARERHARTYSCGAILRMRPQECLSAFLRNSCGRRRNPAKIDQKRRRLCIHAAGERGALFAKDQQFLVNFARRARVPVSARIGQNVAASVFMRFATVFSFLGFLDRRLFRTCQMMRRSRPAARNQPFKNDVIRLQFGNKPARSSLTDRRFQINRLRYHGVLVN